MAQMQPDARSMGAHASFFSVYRSIFSQAFRSSAFWCFVALYLVAAGVYMILGGSGIMLAGYVAYLMASILILLAILPLTRDAPAPAWIEEPLSRRRLLWQTILLFFFTLLFILYSFILFEVIQPLWAKSNFALFLIVDLSTPLLLFCVLPALCMRLLGSGWRALGLTRGYHSWRVTLACCILPLIFAGVLLGIHYFTLPSWLINIFTSLLIAGFPEEVFFRGLLFTRLYRLLGAQWSILLSSLIFGIIHLAANLNDFHNLGIVLAECVLSQTMLGLLFTIIFLRTRSILAGTFLHTLIDSLHF